jgi:hypothetical protein
MDSQTKESFALTDAERDLVLKWAFVCLREYGDASDADAALIAKLGATVEGGWRVERDGWAPFGR